MQYSEKKWQALILLAILSILLVYALYPYMTAFFGAFILYAVFKPLYRFFTERFRIRPGIAALAIIVISTLVILIPVYILLTLFLLQVQVLLQDINWIYSSLGSLFHYIDNINDTIPPDILPVEIDLDLRGKMMQSIATLANLVSVVAVGAISTIGQRLIELIIMYFVLFYLLVGDGSAFAQNLERAIPFNEKNRKKLTHNFTSLVRTILLSSGIIAVLQGIVLTVTFLLLGIEGAFLWGFVTMILAFLPVVGPPVIWVPALALQILQGDYFTAAGVLAGGIVHTFIDEVLRPLVQKRVGAIHPLITVIGVITGLKLFGLLGIIIGPLLISYVLLVATMFHEEYLQNGRYSEMVEK